MWFVICFWCLLGFAAGVAGHDHREPVFCANGIINDAGQCEYGVEGGAGPSGPEVQP